MRNEELTKAYNGIEIDLKRIISDYLNENELSTLDNVEIKIRANKDEDTYMFMFEVIAEEREHYTSEWISEYMDYGTQAFFKYDFLEDKEFKNDIIIEHYNNELKTN